MRELTNVAPGALVTLVASNSLVADTSTCLPIALVISSSILIALAGLALLVGIAPIVGLALITGPASESLLALALPSVGITLFVESSDGIAVAAFASLARGNLPVVRGALIASHTLDVRQARALTREAIAVGYGVVRSEEVAVTLLAVLLQCVPEEPILAELAVVPSSLIQALQASSRLAIAVASVVEIDVVAALALRAGSPVVRHSEEVVRADLAARAGIPFLAVAQHVVVPGVQGAALRMGHSTGHRFRAAARTAPNLTAEQGVSVVPVQAGVAAVAGGRVLAVHRKVMD